MSKFRNFCCTGHDHGHNSHASKDNKFARVLMSTSFEARTDIPCRLLRQTIRADPKKEESSMGPLFTLARRFHGLGPCTKPLLSPTTALQNLSLSSTPLPSARKTHPTLHRPALPEAKCPSCSDASPPPSRRPSAAPSARRPPVSRGP